MRSFTTLLCSLFLFIGALFFTAPLQAKEENTLPLTSWSKLPIIYEGRLKPIDSAATILMEKIVQRINIEGLSPKEWIAEMVFNPSKAMERRVFNVKNIMGFKEEINSNRANYFELTELMAGRSDIIQSLLETEEGEWSKEQTALMELHQNYILYTQLLRSLSALIPIISDVDFLSDTGSREESFNYLDLKRKEEFLQRRTKEIIDTKGGNPQDYTEEELKISAATFQMNVIEQGSRNNILFRIIPNFQTDPINWQAPWDVILSGEASPKSASYIDLWADMASAYTVQSQNQWNGAIERAHTFLQDNSVKDTSVEYWFNKLNLKDVSTLSYAIALLLLTCVWGFKSRKETFLKLALIGFSFSVFVHTALIIFRVIILERPPVGTLYESVLFVSLITSIVMLFLSFNKDSDKKFNSILIGSFLGFILLGTSYGLKDTNSMPTLVAALNTNFWLTVHVLCITIGYAICFIAGLLAHLYLFQKWKKKSKEALRPLFKTILITAVFALLFTTVGTILGGIWADQSWGRFWGWDPKENGALLIVLWLIWLLHSRISGQLRTLGFVSGMAFINIIVVLAWFGVNLLNVGLHSYGFIEGVAVSIFVFCAIEISVISFLTYKAHSIKKMASS